MCFEGCLEEQVAHYRKPQVLSRTPSFGMKNIWGCLSLKMYALGIIC